MIFQIGSIQDFEIVSGNSFCTTNTRDTSIKAISWKWWKIEEIIEKIGEEYNRVNGEPTSLEIKIYFSRWHLQHGRRPFQTVLFQYR